MTENYRLYLQIIDNLRTRRTKENWTAEDDRLDLTQLEELYEKLTVDEQSIAENEGWRSWPDLYDQHMEAIQSTNRTKGKKK